MEKKEMKNWGETVNGIIEVLEEAERNQELAVKLLEEQVISMINDINIQREKEHLKIAKLKKEIFKFYNLYFSQNKKLVEDKIEKKMTNLILMVDKSL